jgi:hypothetical protein
MEDIFAEVEIINSFDLAMVSRNVIGQEEVRHMKLNVKVDTKVYFLFINEDIQSTMNLPVVRKQPFRLSDGSVVQYDVVGPIQLRFANQIECSDAVVLPGNSQPLLGRIPMDRLDVSIHPRRQELVINKRGPASLRPPTRGPLIYTE